MLTLHFFGTAGASLEAGRPRGARGAGSASVAAAAADRGAGTAGRAGAAAAAAAAAAAVAAGPLVAALADLETATATALVATAQPRCHP